jgi:hypothetical protein
MSYNINKKYSPISLEYLLQQGTLVFNLLMNKSNVEFEKILQQLQLHVDSNNNYNSCSATVSEAELLLHFARTVNNMND